MKKTIMLLLLFIFVNAMSVKQFSVLSKAYAVGKPENLSYTLMAIVLVESDAGKYLININSNSLDCGVTMINTKTMADSKWSQARICERLIKDTDFALVMALKRFLYFYNYWKSIGYSDGVSWKRAVCSYNAGYRWRNGIKYYKKIVKTIKKLRKIVKD